MAYGDRRGGIGGVLAALLGLGVLTLGGFAVGLVLGAIWEDPGLVVGHLAGETEEVAWDAEAGSGEGSAAPPETVRRREPQPAAKPPARRAAPPPIASVREPARQAAPAATPPAVGPARVSAPPPLAGTFAVQVGAFAQSESAERLALSLREKGMGVYVSPGAQEGAARWLVRAGPFPSRVEAERLAARIKTEEKLPTWVLQEGGR